MVFGFLPSDDYVDYNNYDRRDAPYVAPSQPVDKVDPRFIPILDNWATASEKDVHLVKLYLLYNPTWKLAVRPWNDGWELDALQFRDHKRPEVATQVANKLVPKDDDARILTASIPPTGYPLTKELYAEMRATIRRRATARRRICKILPALPTWCISPSAVCTRATAGCTPCKSLVMRNM